MRQHVGLVGSLGAVLLVAAVAACDEDSAGSGDAAADATSGQSGASAEARGKYLVDHVALCTDCHTPRGAGGALDMSRYLAGVPCFVDAEPENDAVGCLNSANLTDHETGLRNRSNEEIKDMFLSGMRPDGSALHPVMPYWSYGNMSAEDASAIVAFLRTVDGIEHMVSPNQAPFDQVPAPATRVDTAKIPMPSADYPEQEAAMRGRYLAGQAGVCLECHTENAAAGVAEPRNFDKFFQGGHEFFAADLGLPSPPFPESIVTRNLTPHATGLEGWTVEQIVATLKQGVDNEGNGVCPPMPSGSPAAPMASLGGLTDDDATDIAHYLRSLPPAENDTGSNCQAPAGGG